ncbi:hypothetical protein Tco_1420414 [Tanacetum coccineum]
MFGGVRSLPDTDGCEAPYLNFKLRESALETLICGELVTQLCIKGVRYAEDHASNAQEEAQQKRKEALEEVGVTKKWRELSQEINNHSVPTLISQAPRPARKRSRSPSSPFYPDATTFSDGKPASEKPELNPEDVTARLEDIEVEIDTLHANTKDKELLISELQDSLAAAENEISLLQIRVADVEDRRAEDHDQIQIILARLGL